MCFVWISEKKINIFIYVINVLVLMTEVESVYCVVRTESSYRGADKSLARPGRKQSWNRVRDARDLNNIETRAVIKSRPPPTPARQGAEENSRNSDKNISLFPS